MKSISLHLLMNISVPCLAVYLQETFNHPLDSLLVKRGAGLHRPSASDAPPFFSGDQSTETVNASVSYNTGKYIFPL